MKAVAFVLAAVGLGLFALSWANNNPSLGLIGIVALMWPTAYLGGRIGARLRSRQTRAEPDPDFVRRLNGNLVRRYGPESPYEGLVIVMTDYSHSLAALQWLYDLLAADLRDVNPGLVIQPAEVVIQKLSGPMYKGVYALEYNLPRGCRVPDGYRVWEGDHPLYETFQTAG